MNTTRPKSAAKIDLENTGFFRRPPASILLVALIVSLAVPELHASEASVADPIEGVWTGTVMAPQGTVAEISFEFFRTKHGELSFKLNFPEMFTYNVTFGLPVATDGKGHYDIVDAVDTHLHLEGGALTGTFAPGKLPLQLHRGGSFSPVPPVPHYPPAPKPAWIHPLGAPTWGSPVVAGNLVFVGTKDGKFHAVRASDGTNAWTWIGKNSIDGRAVLDEERVYFIDARMNLVALDRHGGALRWSVALHDEKLAGKPAPDNPTFNHRTATPLLLDGVIYAGSSDGGLYALDAATGRELWRHNAKSPVFSGISVRNAATLMFGCVDGSVVLLDRRNQTELLRVKTGGGVVTTPLAVGNRLIVGSRDYMLYAFNLDDGASAWRYSYWFSWIESTPVLVDGMVYVGASDYRRVTALDPATGRAKWSTDVRGACWGSPLVTTDRVFIGAIAQNIPGTAIEHTGGLCALDRETGRIVWQLLAPKPGEGEFGGYAGSLALAGDNVIAAGFDGNLVALPAH
jgi:outer membrane protein assembly factor BamB